MIAGYISVNNIVVITFYYLNHCAVATVKGAVVIDLIKDSELHCVLCSLTMP